MMSFTMVLRYVLILVLIGALGIVTYILVNPQREDVAEDTSPISAIVEETAPSMEEQKSNDLFDAVERETVATTAVEEESQSSTIFQDAEQKEMPSLNPEDDSEKIFGEMAQ